MNKTQHATEIGHGNDLIRKESIREVKLTGRCQLEETIDNRCSVASEVIDVNWKKQLIINIFNGKEEHDNEH